MCNYAFLYGIPLNTLLQKRLYFTHTYTYVNIHKVIFNVRIVYKKGLSLLRGPHVLYRLHGRHMIVLLRSTDVWFKGLG